MNHTNVELIPKMDRVYVPSTTCFGNIVKKGAILGVKDSFAVVDDTGRKSIYIGKNKGHFIYTESCCNCLGEHCHDVPMDGYQMIKSEYPRCTKFFTTYYDMTLEERNSLCSKWATMTKSQKDAIVKSKK